MIFSQRPKVRILQFLLGLVLLPALTSLSAAQSASVGKSGYPLPRFVSLKSQEVNMRKGPGTQYQIEWRYIKRGLPMEIIQESDNWRKVRDAEGNEGWILHSLLSGKRTVIINPWTKDKKDGLITLHAAAEKSSSLKARIEPGVVADVEGCSENWCHISTTQMSGYVQKQRIWGVYPDELIEE